MYKVTSIEVLRQNKIFTDNRRGFRIAYTSCDFCFKEEEGCIKLQLQVYMNSFFNHNLMRSWNFYFCSEECLNIWTLQNKDRYKYTPKE